MRSFHPSVASLQRLLRLSAGKRGPESVLLLVLWIAGCGGKSTTNPVAPQQSPQTYFAPYVAGTTNGGSVLSVPATYTIDDKIGTFSQTTFQLSGQQVGSQVINAGIASLTGKGLLSLGITANYIPNSNSGTYSPVTYTPPKMGSFAVELAGQAGGLAQLVGQPVAPLVAATKCPGSATPQTYQFVTIPAALTSLGPTQIQFTWDPVMETAYGSVDISSNGSAVTFQNIHQFTLPLAGGTGTPAQPASSSVTGACGSTVFGSITNVPAQLVITDPGNGSPAPPQAAVGVDESGSLLVEDNGTGSTPGTVADTSPALHYQNVLGAGTGAVGLLKPSSALDTGAVAGAQYLGFIYGAGTYPGNASSPTGWSSHLASFGFASVPSSCASVTANTGTLIYGGDFPNDDPSANGSSNCDFAIDLGTQDSSNNGLYPQATVWVGAGFAANTTGKTYSFPAVAIAGQIKGKYAIFLIGADSAQPWAIYLLQSN